MSTGASRSCEPRTTASRSGQAFVSHQVLVVADQQDAVACGDPEEGDEADERRHAQAAAADGDGEDAADERERQVHEDDERVAMAAEGDVEQRIHPAQDRDGEQRRGSGGCAPPPRTARRTRPGTLPAARAPSGRASRASSTTPARSLPATLAVTIARRCTFSRRTRPGPRSKRTRATSAEADDLAPRRRHGKGLEVVAMQPQPLRKANDYPRCEPALHDLAGRRSPWNSASTDCAMPRRREAVARHGLAVEVDEELRHRRPAPGCDRSTIPGTPRSTRSALADRPRRTERSGPKILTARLVLLPEIMWSMRWLIGWPKLTLTPGIVRHRPPHLGEQLRLRAAWTQDDLHLGGVDALTCSSFSARPVRRLVETTSGNASSAFSTSRPRASPSRKRRAQRAHEANREAAFVEGRQERLAEERQDREGRPRARAAAPPRTRRGRSQAEREGAARRRASTVAAATAPPRPAACRAAAAAGTARA